MTNCKYISDYPNLQTGKIMIYECDEITYDNNEYCRFHQKGYLTDDTIDDIRGLFLDKLQNAIDHNESLLCIGYILPPLLLPEDVTSINIPINFARAVFKLGKFVMADIIFNKKVSFWSTTFEDEVKFSGITFHEKILFQHSKFEKYSIFEDIHFNKLCNFTDSIFYNINFSSVIFFETYFLSCEFNAMTKFQKIEFNAMTEFNFCKFFDNCIFYNSNFLSKVSFIESVFLKLTRFSKITFMEQNTYFDNSDLSRVSFSDTDIKMINFGTKVTWGSESKSNNYKIFDELKLENSDLMDLDNEIDIRPNNLESIKNIYRDLRDNYERNLQYEIAGQFFVREMEITRKYKDDNYKNKTEIIKKPICLRIFSIYKIYDIIAKYGQSCKRPFLFEVLIIMCGLVYFTCKGFTIENGDPFHYGVTQTLLSITPFNSLSKDIDPISIIMKITFIMFTGIFFISLKRKLERKFRH